LDPQSASAYKLFALVERGKGNLINSYNYLKIANKLDSNDPEIIGYLYLYLGTYFGKYSGLKPLEDKLFAVDPFSPYTFLMSGAVNYMKGDIGKSTDYYSKCSELFPHIFISKFWLSLVTATDNQISQAVELLNSLCEDKQVPNVIIELALFFKYAMTGEKVLAMKSVSTETMEFIQKDPDLPLIVAGWYSMIDEKETALKYLDRALMKGFCNYQFIAKINPFYAKLRNDWRFIKILDRMKFEWENFDKE
jgi:non-specific serine/threonine protein kinase